MPDQHRTRSSPIIRAVSCASGVATSGRLLAAQNGRCPICKATLPTAEPRPQTPREWEHWLTSTRNTITIVTQVTSTSDEAELRLIHAHCHNRDPALLPAYKPTGLA